jgi:hypothetical protein
MVLGDFNAKVRKEENNYPYAGRNGLHEECNGNRYKLVQFAAATDMIIARTIFTHKNIHKVTWRSPDGVTMNQIDHIPIQKKHSSNLRYVRCKRGVNVDSDHHLVMAKIQARISMNKIHRGQRVQKYNVQSVENEEVQRAFRNKITELNESTSAVEESKKEIEKQWSICEKMMKEVAESVIEIQGPPQRNDWFDDECAEATSLKNRAYKNMLVKKNTRRAREEYQRRRYEEKKIQRRKKREAWKGLMEETEEAGRQKGTRKFYRKANIIRKGYKPRTGICKDKMGNLVTGKRRYYRDGQNILMNY